MAKVDYRALTRDEWLQQPLSVVERVLAEEEAALAALRAELDAATAALGAVRRRRREAATTLARLELEDAEAAVEAEAKRLAKELWERPARWALCSFLRDRRAALRHAVGVARENMTRLDAPLQPGESRREREEALTWTQWVLDTYDR